MKNPTIEEMITALDGKFGDFLDFYETLKDAEYGEDGEIWHCNDGTNALHVVIHEDDQTTLTFGYVRCPSIEFVQPSLKQAITKAYDYFIVRGGEL